MWIHRKRSENQNHCNSLLAGIKCYWNLVAEPNSFHLALRERVSWEVGLNSAKPTYKRLDSRPWHHFKGRRATQERAAFI
jgi:hypothetical protein